MLGKSARSRRRKPETVDPSWEIAPPRLGFVFGDHPRRYASARLRNNVTSRVAAIRGPHSGKVVGVAYAAGAVSHALLFMGYGFYKAEVVGNAGLLVHGAIIGVTPMLAAIASRFSS
jgi:hypothetical protein